MQDAVVCVSHVSLSLVACFPGPELGSRVIWVILVKARARNSFGDEEEKGRQARQEAHSQPVQLGICTRLPPSFWLDKAPVMI